MQRTTAPAGFTVPVTGRLRRHGIRGGEARVTLAGDALQIAGGEGGVLLLAPARVQRMRAGWTETKYGLHHETRLWLEGEAKPLILHLKDRAALADYATAIRGFAAQLAEARGVQRLERGTTAASALFLPVAFGLLTLVALGISIFVLENEPWWGRMIVPLVPIAVLVFVVRLAIRAWPKPVADLAGFERNITR